MRQKPSQPWSKQSKADWVNNMEERSLFGLGVSAGMTAAPVAVFRKQELEIPEGGNYDAVVEHSHFWQALAKVVEETRLLEQRAAENFGAEHAAIFEAHRMMLEDPTFTDAVVEGIDSGLHAARAILNSGEEQAKCMEALSDPYFQERASDLRDLTERLLRTVLGVERAFALNEPCIVVGEDLTPSDTTQFDRNMLLGMICEYGGKTSHTAILARAIGIPAIVGCSGIMDAVQDGMLIAMDASDGTVWLAPTVEQLHAVSEWQNRNAAEQRELDAYRHGETRTADGKTVELFCNIGTPDQMATVLEQGGEGVGLFRSEFLYLDRPQLPNEEEQVAAYSAALRASPDLPIIVRTLDIGGDKQMPALCLPEEDNPFLGCRAIRLCFAQPEMFKTQLRALLRAGTEGKLRIMFPMISSIRELRAAKAILRECLEELRNTGVRACENVQVGMMVEIPSAAVLADLFAREVDFFSIGTNDLIQYTIAADRGNQAVANLYSPCHPSVLRLIRTTIQAAHDNGIPCGMCGEMAGDPLLTPLLLGLGLDELSMNPLMVPRVRKRVSELDSTACRALAEEALQLATVEEIEQLLFQND